MFGSGSSTPLLLRLARGTEDGVEGQWVTRGEQERPNVREGREGRLPPASQFGIRVG